MYLLIEASSTFTTLKELLESYPDDKDILYAKSDLKYIEIHLKNTHYVMRQSLSDIMEILPNTHFIQTHRSYIINKYAVDQIGPNYLKVNNQKIPISMTRKEEVLNNFQRLN